MLKKRRIWFVLLVLIVLGNIPLTAYGLGNEEHYPRIAGENRYDTAAKIAVNQYVSGTDTVVVARGDDLADGLSASLLAGAFNAPILLTASNYLPVETEEAIRELGATSVLIVGGEGAINPAVERNLKKIVPKTERIYGSDRYSTAVAIAKKSNITQDTAFIVNGNSFADALAVGPVVNTQGFPIFLSRQDSIPEKTKEAIIELGIKNIVVVGGHNVINEHLIKEFESIDGVSKVERIAGENRYDTSNRIASRYSKSDEVILVNGTNRSMVDAVGASTFGKAVVFVDGNELNIWAKEYLGDKRKVTVIGGYNAISSKLVEEIKALTVATPETIITNGTAVFRIEGNISHDLVNVQLNAKHQDFKFWSSQILRSSITRNNDFIELKVEIDNLDLYSDFVVHGRLNNYLLFLEISREDILNGKIKKVTLNENHFIDVNVGIEGENTFGGGYFVYSLDNEKKVCAAQLTHNNFKVLPGTYNLQYFTKTDKESFNLFKTNIVLNHNQNNIIFSKNKMDVIEFSMVGVHSDTYTFRTFGTTSSVFPPQFTMTVSQDFITGDNKMYTTLDYSDSIILGLSLQYDTKYYGMTVFCRLDSANGGTGNLNIKLNDNFSIENTQKLENVVILEMNKALGRQGIKLQTSNNLGHNLTSVSRQDMNGLYRGNVDWLVEIIMPEETYVKSIRSISDIEALTLSSIIKDANISGEGKLKVSLPELPFIKPFEQRIIIK